MHHIDPTGQSQVVSYYSCPSQHSSSTLLHSMDGFLHSSLLPLPSPPCLPSSSPTQILDYTNELHPDKEDLKVALELAEKLCKEVNEGVRSTENTEQMEWLQCHVQIVGIEEDLVFNSQTNFMGQRKLLHHGKLTKVGGALVGSKDGWGL